MKFFSLGPLWGEVRGEGGREINETVFARQISLHEPAGWWFSRSHYQRVGRWPCHPGEALETLFKFTQREAYGATFLFAETTSHLETGQPYRNDIALSYRIRSLPSRRGVKNSIRRRRLRDNFFLLFDWRRKLATQLLGEQDSDHEEDVARKALGGLTCRLEFKFFCLLLLSFYDSRYQRNWILNLDRRRARMYWVISEFGCSCALVKLLSSSAYQL